MKASPVAMVRAAVSILPLLAAIGCADPPEDTELAHAVIGPAGGILSSTDSVLTIAIPPGALEEEVELFIQRSDEPPEVFGQAYVVRPNPTLLYDASVTLRQELPQDTSGLAVGAVDLADYEDDRGHWEPLPVLRIDPEAKLVSGLDDGISIFYALLDDADSAAGTTSGGSTSGSTASTADGDTGDTGSNDPTTGPTTGSSAESTGPGESTGEPAVSYADEVEPILEANCSCHIDDVQAGLSLIDGYANLVEVSSTEAAGLSRVEPGAPDDSYLWHKLEGTHRSVGGTGNPMPAPAGGLAAGSLAIIEAWILDGAAP